MRILLEQAINSQVEAEWAIAKHIREGNHHYRDLPEYVADRNLWAEGHERNAMRLMNARTRIMQAVQNAE